MFVASLTPVGIELEEEDHFFHGGFIFWMYVCFTTGTLQGNLEELVQLRLQNCSFYNFVRGFFVVIQNFPCLPNLWLFVVTAFQSK
jgi:hypothetical protein